MSISKTQAAALAEGFLDNLGSDKSQFQPKNTYTEVFLLVGELIDTAQNNLNKANRIASGALSESIIGDDPVKNAGVLRVDVLMNFYGAFVNKGVKGTRSGSSTAGYSFKNEVVSRNMYYEIETWIKRAQIDTRSVKKYKGYGKHEVKQKTIAQYDATYAVARSIKIHGLKPTGFMDNAISKTSDKIEKRLGAALVVDVLDGLK
jgi:hypothetical protein